MKLEVNPELLPIKAHYFFFNAGTAPVVPFIPTLARQLGFSTVVVGFIYTMLPLFGMFAKPLFGLIADRYQRHRFIFIFSEVVIGISFFLIMFIPAIPQAAPTVELHCHDSISNLSYCKSNLDNCTQTNLEKHFGHQVLVCKLHCQAEPYLFDIICQDWLRNGIVTNCTERTNSHFDITTLVNMSRIINQNECLFFPIPHDRALYDGVNVVMNCPTEKKYFKTSCEIDCNEDYIVNQLSESPVIKNSDAMKLYQFWLLFILLIISWIGMAVVVSIGDAICLNVLGNRPTLFGKQRLSGSLGWGIFSLLAGFLVDQMSADNSATKNYTVIFWMTAIMMAFDVFASTKLKHVQANLSENILKDVGRVFHSIRCVVFIIWCVSCGILTALIWNFLFWYLEDLGTKMEGCGNNMKTLEGLVMAIQCFCGEVLFFFLSEPILRKLGQVHCMSLVLFTFAIRFILYSMLKNPWWVLPIEFLNGLTFSIYYAAMASYTSIIAPPGTEATMQGLVGAIFEGIGVSLGSLVGGILFDRVGGHHTFRIFSGFAFVAFVVHVCVQQYLKKKASDGNGKKNSNVSINENQNHTISSRDHSDDRPYVVESSNSKTILTNNVVNSEGAEFTDIDLN